MIEVRSLSKSYGTKRAVDNLSFSLEQGQVLGLIGPNGAGKTTTMRMITGCLYPTSGHVQLDGNDIWKYPTRAKQILGYLPEDAPSYPEFTVREYLEYIASLRFLQGKDKHRSVERVIDLCYLKNVTHQLIDTLSKGYRHRICLAQSIIHDPKILVFDEPTDGLDPNQKLQVRSLIAEIRKNKTIIVSTHILDEAETICSDILLLDRGKKVIETVPSKFRSMSAAIPRVTLEFKSLNPTEIQSLKNLDLVETVNVLSPNIIEVQTDARNRDALPEQLDRIHEFLVTQNLQLRQMKVAEKRIEEIFRELTHE